VNSALVLLYWRVGQRIRQDIVKEKRAEYGEQIVATLSQQLTDEFGEGWSRYNLSRTIRFTECFPEEQIVATLSQQLGWSHFKEIIPLDDDIKRDFYAEMCRIERWSVRTLRQKISGMLFERTALSKKPAANFLRVYKPLADSWTIFDNSGDVPRMIAIEESEKIEILDPNLFGILLRFKGNQ